MTHPKNKAERLANEQKKERARLREEDRASKIRAKLAREGLKVRDLESEVVDAIRDG